MLTSEDPGSKGRSVIISARMQPMANMSTGGPYLRARSSTSGARYLHQCSSARETLPFYSGTLRRQGLHFGGNVNKAGMSIKSEPRHRHGDQEVIGLVYGLSSSCAQEAR